MKIAKEWFRANPRSVVAYHWRWMRLPAQSREFMAMPRTAEVHGHYVTFGPHRSELSLLGKTAEIGSGGELMLKTAAGNHFVTYRGVT